FEPRPRLSHDPGAVDPRHCSHVHGRHSVKCARHRSFHVRAAARAHLRRQGRTAGPRPGMKMNGRSKRDTPGLGRDEIAWLTATELVSAFKTRSLSPLEVTKAILARIERLDPLLKAFVLVDSEGALAAASKAEARWAGGRPLGLLDGVPVSIKDIVLTRGLPTRRGSRLIDPDQAWDED